MQHSNHLTRDVAVLGIGKLGICFALVLEKYGYHVIGVDLSQEYIDSINNKTLKSDEAEVETYLRNSENFYATTNLAEAVAKSSTLFVMVATPSLENGSYDHSQIDSIVDQLIKLGRQDKLRHLVICCTTMPGYCQTVLDRVKELNYTVSYNPEFIAQGTVIRNLQYPDMALIGESSSDAGDVVEELYKKFYSSPAIHRMSLMEAELCKISLNCFLVTKIAFANMIGDIAVAANCSPDKILNAIGDDSRIGKKCLKYGFGPGGPCLPRDSRALGQFAKSVDLDPVIAAASDASSVLHLSYQVEHFVKNNPDKSKPVIMDYVTYKKESTLITDSQQLAFALELKKRGYTIIVKDERPSVVKQLQGIL